MGYLLILVGIGLIGFYVYSLNETSNQSPQSHPSKFIYGGVGVGCFLLAAYLLYSVGTVWSYSGWTAFVYLVFTVSLTIAGGNLMKAAYDADQKEAEDMEARARTKAAEAEAERQRIARVVAEAEAKANAELEDEHRKTQAAALKAQRREFQIRDNLADTAEGHGLNVDSLIEINTGKYKQDIQTDGYAKVKAIDFQFRKEEKILEVQSEAELIRQQMEAADRVEHYKIIKGLDKRLKKLLKERREVELNETDEWLKEKNLARLDQRIAETEADINGRQNRLLSASDGKEIKRLT